MTKRECRRTVDWRLELLTADFAGKFTGARFLVQLDRNRFFVITEEAWKVGWKWFFLQSGHQYDRQGAL